MGTGVEEASAPETTRSSSDQERGQEMTSLRTMRLERGFSQLALAIAVGVTPNTIHMWEKQMVRPHMVALERLGEVLEVDPDEIDLAPYKSPGRPRMTPSR